MTTSKEHGVRRYRLGCRCDVCRAAESARKREQHLRTGRPARRPAPLAAVPPLPPAEPPAPGPDGRVVAGVRAEIGQLAEGVAERYPGLVETALTLAAGLDNPKGLTSHPALAARLFTALGKLEAASAGGRGKLAAVSSMSRRDNRNKPS